MKIIPRVFIFQHLITGHGKLILAEDEKDAERRLRKKVGKENFDYWKFYNKKLCTK